MSKKPPVALKKLAYFLNNINKQIGGKIEVVICTIYGEGNGTLSLYFDNQAVISHEIKNSSHSIQFNMEYVKDINSISNSHLHMYAGILAMYQSELKGVIRNANIEEIDNHTAIFHMPFELRMFQ